MNLESEHNFKIHRTNIMFDNYKKAGLTNQEFEISVNVGSTTFEATTQDGRLPKS